MIAYTLRGNRVEIIDWSTDSYLVRFADGGATKWMHRSLFHPAVA